jgi:hypothetical protein
MNWRGRKDIEKRHLERDLNLSNLCQMGYLIMGKLTLFKEHRHANMAMQWMPRLRKCCWGGLKSAPDLPCVRSLNSLFTLNINALEGMNNWIKVSRWMACNFQGNDYFLMQAKTSFPGIP